MDSFNKIISFVLGLVVVIVFFAVVTGRLNFKGGLPKLTKATTTPSQSPTPTPTSTANKGVKITIVPTGTLGRYEKQVQKTGAQIPATGLPTLFIPSLIAGAAGGAFLRKSGKKQS